MPAQTAQPADHATDHEAEHSAQKVEGKPKYSAKDIQNAAWAIIQHDDTVKKAFLFYSQIMFTVPKDQWDAELAKFFKGGHSPKVKLRRNLHTSGSTREDKGPREHKVMKINSRADFGYAVATYMHEMSHYADIWYSSKAAKKEGMQRSGAERGARHRSGKEKHLAQDEQTSARVQGVDATIERILVDMQSKTPGAQRAPLPRKAGAQAVL